MSYFFFVLGANMALTITETTFITSQKSGVAAVDVYGKAVANSPINTGVKKSQQFKPNLFNMWGTTNGKLNAKIEKLVEAIGDGGPSSVASVFKNLDKIVGNKKDLLNEMKGAVLTDVFTGLGFGDKAVVFSEMVMSASQGPIKMLDGLAKISPDMEVIVGGVRTVVNAKDLDTATGIAKVLGELTGNEKLIEVTGLGAEALALSGLLAKANMFAIPQLTDAIIGKVEDKRARKKLLLHNTPSATRYSDIETIKLIVEENTGTGVKEAYPDVIKRILANYRTKHGGDPVKEDTDELLSLLASIEPNWWSKNTRSGGASIRADYFHVLSNHAILALQMVEPFKYWTHIVSKYPPAHPSEMLLRYRPWIKLPTTSVLTSYA